MSDTWYEIVAPDISITQGDIIFDCPLLIWREGQGELKDLHVKNDEADTLGDMAMAYRDDVVVLTQACDLEHDKVNNVVLCPHVPLSRFRQVWESTMTQMKQTPSQKAWRRTCVDIANGHLWNHAFLNKFDDPEIKTEVRVVDFRDVFTLPRQVLNTGNTCLKLSPVSLCVSACRNRSKWIGRHSTTDVQWIPRSNKRCHRQKPTRSPNFQDA